MPVIDTSIFDPNFDGRQLAAGDTVFVQGDPADCMYVVLSGEVEITIGTAPPVTLGPGDLFGELALLDEGRRSGTAVAATDGIAVPIGRLRFEYFVRRHPSFALEVLDVVVRRLRSERARRPDLSPD